MNLAANFYLKILILMIDFNATRYFKDFSSKSTESIHRILFLNIIKNANVLKVLSKREVLNKKKRILSQNENKHKKFNNNPLTPFIKMNDNADYGSVAIRSEKFIFHLYKNSLVSKISHDLFGSMIFTIYMLIISLLTAEQNKKHHRISKYEMDHIDFQYTKRKFCVVCCFCLFGLLYFCIINNDHKKRFGRRNYSGNFFQFFNAKVFSLFYIETDEINIKVNKNFITCNENDMVLCDGIKEKFLENKNPGVMVRKKPINFEKDFDKTGRFNCEKLYNKKYISYIACQSIIGNEVSRNICYNSLFIYKYSNNIFDLNKKEKYFNSVNSSILRVYTIYKEILIFDFNQSQNINCCKIIDYKKETNLELTGKEINLKSHLIKNIDSKISTLNESNQGGYVKKDRYVVLLIILVKIIAGNIFDQHKKEKYFSFVNSLILRVYIICKEILIFDFNQSQNIDCCKIIDYKKETNLELKQTEINLKSRIIKNIYSKISTLNESNQGGYVTKDGDVVLLIILVKIIAGNILFPSLWAIVKNYLRNKWLYYKDYWYSQTIFNSINSNILIFSILKDEVFLYLIKERYFNYHHTVFNSFYILIWKFVMRNMVNIQSNTIDFIYALKIIEIYERRILCFINKIKIHQYFECLNNGEDNYVTVVSCYLNVILHFNVNEHILEGYNNIAIQERFIVDFYFHKSTHVSNVILLDIFLRGMVPILDNSGDLYVDEEYGLWNIEYILDENNRFAIPENAIPDLYFQESMQINHLILLDNFHYEIVHIPENNGHLFINEEYGYGADNIAIPENAIPDLYFQESMQVNHLILLDNFGHEIIPIPEIGGGDMMMHDIDVDNIVAMELDNGDILHGIFSLNEDNNDAIVNEIESGETVFTTSGNDYILRDDSCSVYEDNNEILAEGAVIVMSHNGNVSQNDFYCVHEDDNDTVVVESEERETVVPTPDGNNIIQNDSYCFQDPVPNSDVNDKCMIENREQNTNCDKILLRDFSSNVTNVHISDETQIDEDILPMLDTNMIHDVSPIDQQVNHVPVSTTSNVIPVIPIPFSDSVPNSDVVNEKYIEENGEENANCDNILPSSLGS